MAQPLTLVPAAYSDLQNKVHDHLDLRLFGDDALEEVDLIDLAAEIVTITNGEPPKVQDTAERFTRAQSCHGSPTVCGCGGDCPAGGIAA